jgi:putative flippase GtrA
MSLIQLFHPDKIKSRYLRAQMVAVIATGIDFGATLFTKELVRIHYVYAVAFGALCGAVTAFLLNRHWVFAAGEGNVAAQALRYSMALGGSVVLNTAGTYAITELVHSHYLLSKAMVAVAIGVTYSYFVLKTFVFTADANK